MNKVYASLIVILGIVAFHSCETRERTVMNKEEKSLLDSLYAKNVSSVRRMADSICDAQYQRVFDSAKDSFYQSYVKEIEAIFNGEG